MAFEDLNYLETVYAALFELLRAATFAGGLTLKRTERTMLVPDEVPPADQPALILVPGPMEVEQRQVIGPAKWTLTALAVIYLRAESTAPTQEPLAATQANHLIWGIQNAFATRPPYDKQTLGGLVYHCWIEGAIEPVAQREQVIITLPIWILPGPVE